MYYFLDNIITDLHNSIHFTTGLNHLHNSSVWFGSAKKLEVQFSSGLAKIPGSIIS